MKTSKSFNYNFFVKTFVKDIQKSEIPNWIGLSFPPCEEELSSHE